MSEILDDLKNIAPIRATGNNDKKAFYWLLIAFFAILNLGLLLVNIYQVENQLMEFYVVAILLYIIFLVPIAFGVYFVVIITCSVLALILTKIKLQILSNPLKTIVTNLEFQLFLLLFEIGITLILGYVALNN